MFTVSTNAVQRKLPVSTNANNEALSKFNHPLNCLLLYCDNSCQSGPTELCGFETGLLCCTFCPSNDGDSDADPGSGAFLLWIRDKFFRILDLGSRSPNQYFLLLMSNFWVKSTIILSV
jgi:hypothetical protein